VLHGWLKRARLLIHPSSDRTMNLAELVTSLTVQIGENEHWSILGPEATAFESKVELKNPSGFLSFSQKIVPELDGLLLAGALSATTNSQDWLQQITNLMTQGATLVVIDWQADGLLKYGPPLDRRFKNGRLRRLLRETGFGVVQLLDDHPLYYIVKGIKGPSPPALHPDEFIDVAGLDELSKNDMKQVEIFGRKVVVANTGKEIVAFAQRCPHTNGPLDKGLLRGRKVVCPLHGYIWDVCTGEPIEPADEDILPRYTVQIDSEQRRILVALAPLKNKNLTT